MPYLTENPDGSLILAVYVQPRASRSRLVAIHGNSLKLAITAAPVDNQANMAVIRFFAKLLDLPKTAISIRKGAQGRSKLLALQTISAEQVRAVVESQLHS